MIYRLTRLIAISPTYLSSLSPLIEISFEIYENFSWNLQLTSSSSSTCYFLERPLLALFLVSFKCLLFLTPGCVFVFKHYLCHCAFSSKCKCNIGWIRVTCYTKGFIPPILTLIIIIFIIYLQEPPITMWWMKTFHFCKFTHKP